MRFSREFYVTTNQQTFVRLKGRETKEAGDDGQCDCGGGEKAHRTCGEIFDVRKGDELSSTTGHPRRSSCSAHVTTRCFSIHQYQRWPEEPKQQSFELGEELKRARAARQIAVVAGRAVVLTGAGEHLQRL